jgi:predicted nuclease with TOPRIM domain
LSVTPEISEVPQLEQDRVIETNTNKSVQVSIPSNELENLRYHCKVLTRKLKNLNSKYSKCLAKVNDLEVEIQKQSHDRKIMDKISNYAEHSDQKALFLMDLINNYIKSHLVGLK